MFFNQARISLNLKLNPKLNPKPTPKSYTLNWMFFDQARVYYT